MSPDQPATDLHASKPLTSDELKEAGVSGARWAALSRVGLEVVGFGSGIALARLVAPAEFGRAAIALVLPMLAVILTFEGFGGAIVQKPTITDAFIRASVMLSTAAGLALSAAVALLALTVLDDVFDRQTAHLILFVSPVFIAAGMGATSRAILQRRLDFRRIMGFEVIATATGLSVALLLAVGGFGAYAIASAGLVGTFVEAVLMVATVRPPRPRGSRSEVTAILRYGLPASGAGVAYSLRRNVDYLILGTTLRPATLGQYYRAYNVGAEYQSKLTGVMLRVVFPLFSRSADLEAVRSLRRRISRTNALIALPALGFVIVLAPEVVPLLFGDRWLPAVNPARLLAVAGMALALLSGTEALILALGKPHTLLRFNLTFLVLYTCVLVSCATSSLTTICAGVAIVHLAMLLLAQETILRRHLGVGWRAFVDDVGAAMVATAALVAVGIPGTEHLRASGAGRSTVLVVGTAMGLVAYIGVLFFVFPSVFRELADTTRSVVRGRRQGSSG